MSDRAARVADTLADLESLHRSPASAHLGWRLIPTAGESESQAVAWRDADAWVTWLVDTYEFEDWPTCWRHHAGLVQETIALRLDHASVIAAHETHALVVWHESVAQLRRRAAGVAGRCHGGKRCSRRLVVD